MICTKVLFVSSDLSGCRIESSAPIAVFGGNIETEVSYDFFEGARSHLVEQLPPVANWGTEFYLMPFPGRTNADTLKVVASAPATTVQVSKSEMSVSANYKHYIGFVATEQKKLLCHYIL